MEKKQFQAESKRLLEMMIHSIYTKREIFLRELISNASDAIDKIYYKALSDEQMVFNPDDYYIEITAEPEPRLLTIRDTGIGMTKEEMEHNLGVIAQSGSLAFKQQVEQKDGHSLIGQFGVGFYSAFMVADEITVVSQALGATQAYRWHSTGTDGYTIEEVAPTHVGTTIVLKIKEDSIETSLENEDFTFDFCLHPGHIKSLVKKYSDFIRYPIKLSDEVINSMIPIWRKNKSELTDEAYTNFYNEKHYGFDKPLKHLHIQADGAVRYQSILYIPTNPPFNFYSQNYERGLELYANGVLIMEKCADLIPDYFAFVKGMVDSEDLSLNISREMLQHDRQLNIISRNVKNKIKSALQTMLNDERETYETFYKSFGRQIKFGVYNGYGANKEDLQDLLLYYSSTEQKLVSLQEYVSRMKENQKYIYYATGESIDRIVKLPQTEVIAERGIEMLYCTEDIDEFALKMLNKFGDKEFRSVSSGDLGLEPAEQPAETTATEEASHDALFEAVKTLLEDKVKHARPSKRLKSHPVCLTTEGDLTIEMEKVLKNVPNRPPVQAEKVLEINTNHHIFHTLTQLYEHDRDKFALYVGLLYNQALLIEGLPIADPVAFSNDLCKVMV